MSRMKSLNYNLLLMIITIEFVKSVIGTTEKASNMIFNDGELVILNDQMVDAEIFGTWNEDIDVNKFIPPISDADIKCIMHVDRYCSSSMVHIKDLLIKALKDDCENCTIKEKESVGKIVASMWAYDSQLWKLFLKRFDSTETLKRII